MVDSLAISAEVITEGSNSVAVFSSKLFYWVSQELLTWIKDSFIIGHEVFWKKTKTNL